MTAVLTLHAVDKRFGATEIIRQLSLSVHAGERVAIIGPNGAGKSTLFHLISGRLAPSAGHIELHGQPIEGLAPSRIQRLGLARSFQITSVFGSLSVLDNLRCAVLGARGQGGVFWRRLSRWREVNDAAEAMLHHMGLQARRDWPAMHLTYAEQRTLEIGLTLAGDAPVILLDEPTAGMSQAETAQCTALIRRLTEGKTLLMVEHDMGVVFDLADRIAVLAQGELLAFDTPAAIAANAQVQAAYLGDMPELAHG